MKISIFFQATCVVALMQCQQLSFAQCGWVSSKSNTLRVINYFPTDPINLEAVGTNYIIHRSTDAGLTCLSDGVVSPFALNGGSVAIANTVSVGDSATTSERDTSFREYIYFPRELPAWKFVKTLGFTLAYVPAIISEEEINQSPLIDFNMRLGLPYNFSANARISTIGITNNFLIGGQWNHSFNNFSFGIGFDFAYWLGSFRRPDFNVVANGTMNFPFISFGFDFDDFYVSLRAEAQIVTFSETFIGDASVGGIQKELAGFTITYALEQLFWKNTHIVQGVRLSYTKFFYQSWLSFSTFDRYIFFPEFIIGIQL